MQSRASFLEAASVALDSLRSSKLRSFLTLLGIILSTMTLIGVNAVIHGMDVYVANSASTMGTEGFRLSRMAFVGRRDAKAFVEALRKNPELSLEEYAFVRSRVTLAREIGISAQRGAEVAYGADLVNGVILQGLTANSGIMTNTQVESGRFFTGIEDQRHLAVLFLGPDVRDRFFPNADPVGKTVGVDGQPFQVIGVGRAKGSVFGQSQDNYVAIPSQTYFKIYGSRVGLNYNFLAVDRAHLEQAQDEVRTLVRSFRHLRPRQDDNFAIVSSDTLVSAWDQLTGVIAAVAVAVVSVFMVVGGVVIMNIMLAVVSERTREIGVRKSVGARRQDILNQFLIESSILAGCGGLAGVLLAWIAAVVVRNFTPVPMQVPAGAVILGVALSTTVGLFFGIYPARTAARLDPIVALRSEK